MATNKFCQSCGAAVDVDAKSGGVRSTENVDTGADNGLFAFLLSEERIRAVSDRAIPIPYGCSAIVFVDNVLATVQTQVPETRDSPGMLERFVSRVIEGAKAIVGVEPRQIKTWIISDYRKLPIISYTHRIALPDATEARARFDFWIDVSESSTDEERAACGVFFQRFLDGRKQLTVEEFRVAAVRGIQAALAQTSEENLQNQDDCNTLLGVLRRTTGISGRCVFSRGRDKTKRYFEASANRKPVSCASCGFVYGAAQASPLKFCENCGSSMSSRDWLSASTYLQSAELKPLVVRFSALVDSGAAIEEQALTESVVNALRPVLINKHLEAFAVGSFLAELSSILNTDIPRRFAGQISDLNVLDLRATDQDWIFKTEALISSEMQRLESQQRLLDVDDRELAYREAEFALQLRTLHQDNEQAIARRKSALDLSQKNASLAIDERRLQNYTSLELERLDADTDRHRDEMRAQIDARKFEADRERLLRERDLTRDVAKGARADEFEQADHEMRLEKQVAQHDAQLSDLVGEAQSRAQRRAVDDKTYSADAELQIRLKERERIGNLEEDLADRQNQRQVDKLRAMADMEARMTSQEQDFQLAKAQQLKGLDAAQILAMQAAELVKAGGQAASAEIVKSIAQSQADARNQADRDHLYSQMLEIKDKATALAIDAHKVSVEAVNKANSDLTRIAIDMRASSADGYKEAAKVAQSTSEKSMDAMQKVAAAATSVSASNQKSGKAAKERFECASCGKELTEKKKFCPHCGSSQSAA